MQAQRQFEAALANNRNDADAAGGLGVVRLRQSRFAESAELLSRASSAAIGRAGRKPWHPRNSTPGWTTRARGSRPAMSSAHRPRPKRSRVPASRIAAPHWRCSPTFTNVRAAMRTRPIWHARRDPPAAARRNSKAAWCATTRCRRPRTATRRRRMLSSSAG
ncbi:hypothetical protein QP150_01135 [Sphingomonas sp. 22L2VL55-3]